MVCWLAPLTSSCTGLLLVEKGVTSACGGILSDGAVGAVSTSGTSVVPNDAVIGANTGCISVSTFRVFVVVESSVLVFEPERMFL